LSPLLVLAALVALPLGTPNGVHAQDATPKPRVFAPGVETVIPVELNPEETTAVHDIIELRAQRNLNWNPKLLSPSRTLYSKAESVRFRRDVWQLQFAFKPLRMMWVDIPTASGESQRTLVWYLVYRVTNGGEALTPTQEEGGFYSSAKRAPKPVRYLPHFVLEGHEQDAAGKKLYRAYLDRVIPAAIEPIRRREVPGRKLLNSVEMAAAPIPVSSADALDGEGEQSVWGVATWVGVDSEMDFFSVYARGLTNAYRWEDPNGAYQVGDPPGKGRQFVRKTLQLNFWRPGDRFLEHESEVRFGVAPGKSSIYGVDEGVAYRWVYR